MIRKLEKNFCFFTNGIFKTISSMKRKKHVFIVFGYKIEYVIHIVDISMN